MYFIDPTLGNYLVTAAGYAQTATNSKVDHIKMKEFVFRKYAKKCKIQTHSISIYLSVYQSRYIYI